MTSTQIVDAVRQMEAHCKLLMEQYKAGTGEYATVSARSVLYDLGFGTEDAEQVLLAIGKTGFWYCLDYAVPAEDDGRRFSRDACWWGADQLESRLHGIPERIEWEASRVNA